jgi:hypothetical protein
MPQSKKRGGAKAHRKKIENRNNQVKAQQSAMQKLFNEAIKAQIDELKKKNEETSGQTEN